VRQGQELGSEVRSLLESHRRVQHTNRRTFETSESRTQPDPPKEKPADGAPPSPPATPHRTHHNHSSAGGRFEPGRILCERYRIVSQLGIGGMERWYRADDLTLDQPVAPEISADFGAFRPGVAGAIS